MTSSKVDQRINRKIEEFFDQKPDLEWVESDTKDEEEQPQKVLKSPEFLDAGSDDDDEGEEPHSSPESVEKELTQPVKLPSVARRTPSCTYILTSGINKDKQCKLKASDERGKFCHPHKRQP